MAGKTIDPVIVPVGGGKVWNIVGERVTVKATGEQTGGAYSVFEEASPPGGGPPLHVHEKTDEIFYVLDGDCEVICGARTIRAAKETMFFVPKGVAHTLRNVGATMSRVLVIHIPAGFEKFFEEAGGVTDPGRLMEIAERHDVRFVTAGGG